MRYQQSDAIDNYYLSLIPFFTLALIPEISPSYRFSSFLTSRTAPFLRILALRNLILCLTRGFFSSFLR
ncbi:hypothetical protein G9C98_000430 [Cotesia typhae]|uniref:Uncharacterized protein n=1 Tax=Cotesia typhae TaxID=2053667 RepID=A0A8J5QUT6_9HYME|nr:hypothetical protein G9C98_000430 [Cotesia typhae]